MVARSWPFSTASPTPTSMEATVPACGATTGISIFIASSVTIASPGLTDCPTEALTFVTLPGTEALTFTEPAPAEAAFGAAAFGAAAFGAAAGAAFGAAAGAAAEAPFSSTVTSYTLPLTVHCH